MLDLVLNHDGVDGDPSVPIRRFLFEQVLFGVAPGKGLIERREPDRFFYLISRLGAAIEIDTDEGDPFGSIYISVSEKNPPEATNIALALARIFADELGLKVINPVEGILYDVKSLPDLKRPF